MNCICGVLEEINGFSSICEFEWFQFYLANLINEKELIKVHMRRAQR